MILTIYRAVKNQEREHKVSTGFTETKLNAVLPFEHSAGVGILADASHHPAVLQGHAFQQPIVHVIPNPDGEDAELLLHGRAGVAQDGRGLDLPDGGPPVRQENDEGHAVGAGVGAQEVIAKQGGAGLDGTIDVCACGGGISAESDTRMTISRIS